MCSVTIDVNKNDFFQQNLAKNGNKRYNKNILKNVRKDCLIIDLASKPGGTDLEECKKLGINAKLELALPGRVAPKTSAKYIKQSIYNIMEGEKWEQ